MRKQTLSLLWPLAGCLASLGPVDTGDLNPPPLRRPAEEVMNFALIDHRGRFHELRRADARVVILFFTENGCAIARQSIWKLRTLQQRCLEHGVAVWMINSNPQDDRPAIVREAEAFRSE